MNVITVASCKGGTGKTTLTAQLAGFACAQGRRCLVIDADPKGTFALHNSRRVEGALPLATAARGIERQLAVATILGYDWVLIDTPAQRSAVTREAVGAATMLIIPARPGLFDLAAVRETADLVRECNKPFAVIINIAPVKRDDNEAPAVAEARAFLAMHDIPVWAGQVSERTGFAHAAGEADARALAAAEIARLWSMIERSVETLNAAQGAAAGSTRAA
ncbi:MAG: chromosome partitioning protein [Alphaproteobacteria bacterium]|jgi:chromosome partitioning protein|nr:chromosome partitioning protein [Alphaproteobacteria bacterium]